MNVKEWIEKTIETECTLNPENLQSYEEDLQKEGYITETGDQLPVFGHWFCISDYKDRSEEDFFFIPENRNVYWKSGSIKINESLKAGNTCKLDLKIKKADFIHDTDQSLLVSLSQKISDGRVVAIEEEIQFLITDDFRKHEKTHRINFDPDWEVEVKQNKLNSIHRLRPVFHGIPANDLLSSSASEVQHSKQNQLNLQGSPAALLLIESFSRNFESRVIQSLKYQSFSFHSEEPLTIASRDSDTYQTSMRLINSRRQVLFSAEIQWNYSW